MHPVIATVDPDCGVDDVVGVGAELAGFLDTDLVAVVSVEPPFSEIAPDDFDRFVDERRRAVEHLVAARGSHAAVVHLLGGDPLDALTEIVTEHRDAVVVLPAGAHAAGPWSTATARHLLRRGNHPVLTVHGTPQPLAHRPILVGVDGSSANDRALDAAAELARAVDGPLVALFAYDPLDDTFELPAGWHRHIDDVHRAVDRVGTPPVELLVEPGRPDRALLALAQRRSAGVAVVGTRGRGGLEGLRLGRTAEHVLRDADLPVLVVPHR